MQLPSVETAKNSNFAHLASKIRDFLIFIAENRIAVDPNSLHLLDDLMGILKAKLPPSPDQISIPPEPQASIFNRYGLDNKKQRLKSIKKHNEWVLKWRKIRSSCDNRTKTYNLQHKIYSHRLSEVNDLIGRGGHPDLAHVRWYILPPGFWPRSMVEVERISPPKSSETYRPERIINAVRLNPFEIGRGRDDFNEYLFFRYKSTQRVLLESPHDGNAAYILIGDWRALSRLSKHELITEHSNSIRRIIHRQDAEWETDIARLMKF